jgi:hypothetical protein
MRGKTERIRFSFVSRAISLFFHLLKCCGGSGTNNSIDLSQSWTNSTVQKYSIDTQRPVTDGHW